VADAVMSSVPGDEPGVLVPAAEALLPADGEALPDDDDEVPVAALVAFFVAVAGAGPEELAAADRVPHGDVVDDVVFGLPLVLGCAEAVALAVPLALPVRAGLAVPVWLGGADDCGAALGLTAALAVAVPDGLPLDEPAPDGAVPAFFGASGEPGADDEHEADAAGLADAPPSATPDAPLPMAWPGPLPRGPAPPVELVPEITADTPLASTERSGGTARATPMANRAHATPSAGRSSACGQSRASRGARRAWLPGRAGRPAAAWAGPDRILARIRSRPSGRGSTQSTAACSSRRT